MTKKDDSSSSSIVSSPYFQSKIVDAYLNSALDSPSFPSKAIQAIHTLAIESDNVEDNNITELFDEVNKNLSPEKTAALQDVIRALSSHLTLCNSDNGDDDEKPRLTQYANRCLLANCKILNRQWQEAVVDLDLVRADIYRRSKGQKGMGKESKNIYMDALAGLQLSSLLLGKTVDFDRFSNWRKKAANAN